MASLSKDLQILSQVYSFCRAYYYALNPYEGFDVANSVDIEKTQLQSLAPQNLTFDQQLLFVDQNLGLSALASKQYNQQFAVGVNLYGYLNADFGLGEDVRGVLEVFKRLNIEVDIYALNQPTTVVNGYYGLVTNRLESSPRFTINIFCASIFELIKFYADSPDKFVGYYNIAYSPWELSTISSDFKFMDLLIDEFWVPTRFVFDSYKKTFENTVTLMPYCLPHYITEYRVRKKSFFEKRCQPFHVLVIADFNSSISRKNIFLAIEAFQKALTNKNTLLTVKIMGQVDSVNLDKLNRISLVDDRVHLINTTLSKNELLSLLNKADVLMSTHRSEGFGRVPLEAMALSVNVISVNYSGESDYLSYFNSYHIDHQIIKVKKNSYPFSRQGDVWADPLIDSAIQQLKNVYTSNLSSTVKQYFGRKTAKKYNAKSLTPLYKKELKRIVSSLK